MIFLVLELRVVRATAPKVKSSTDGIIILEAHGGVPPYEYQHSKIYQKEQKRTEEQKKNKKKRKERRNDNYKDTRGKGGKCLGQRPPHWGLETTPFK